MAEAGKGEQPLNEQEIKEFLKSKKCEFREVERLKIPDIDKGKIEKSFPPKSITSVYGFLIPELQDFLSKGEIIIDPVNTDVSDPFANKKKWRDERRSWKPEVGEYYEKRNMLRGNCLALVINAIETLAHESTNEDIRLLLLQKYQALYNEIYGLGEYEKQGRYDDRGNEGKIDFVNKVQQAALDTLNLFAPEPPEPTDGR